MSEGDSVEDRKTGISIRFVKQWDIEMDDTPTRDDLLPVEAIPLLMCDARDVPFATKLADALAFLRSRNQ